MQFPNCSIEFMLAVILMRNEEAIQTGGHHFLEASCKLETPELRPGMYVIARPKGSAYGQVHLPANKIAL